MDIIKRHEISLIFAEALKHPSAMIFTVRLSVQTFLLYRSIINWRDFCAVLSLYLTMYWDMNFFSSWLIWLFLWCLFIRLISFRMYLYKIFRNYLSSMLNCFNKNSIVLIGYKIFFALKIITAEIHFFLLYGCSDFPSSFIRLIVVVGTKPNCSGKKRTDLAKKMRSYPNR